MPAGRQGNRPDHQIRHGQCCGQGVDGRRATQTIRRSSRRTRSSPNASRHLCRRGGNQGSRRGLDPDPGRLSARLRAGRPHRGQLEGQSRAFWTLALPGTFWLVALLHRSARHHLADVVRREDVDHRSRDHRDARQLHPRLRPGLSPDPVEIGAGSAGWRPRSVWSSPIRSPSASASRPNAGSRCCSCSLSCRSGSIC